jgi:hypothetical protein
MAQAHGGGQPRLGLPFLIETSTDRHRRSLDIIQETLVYLGEVSVAMPLIEMADSLPQNAPRPSLPESLECFEWERRVDKWGLLNPGTWLDQPKWFMEDIRAASSGYTQWQAERHQQDVIQGINIPQIAPGITR